MKYMRLEYMQWNEQVIGVSKDDLVDRGLGFMQVLVSIYIYKYIYLHVLYMVTIKHGKNFCEYVLGGLPFLSWNKVIISLNNNRTLHSPTLCCVSKNMLPSETSKIIRYAFPIKTLPRLIDLDQAYLSAKRIHFCN